MKSVSLALLCCFSLALSTHVQAVCKINHDKDFLYSHVTEAELPMLEFYYLSLCRTEQVDLATVPVPSLSSSVEQALYYFGLKNLSRYEGLKTPLIPDLIQLGQQANSEWIIAEAKLNQAITKIDRDLLIEAETLLRDIVPVATELGYRRLLARAYRWLGNIKAQESNIKASLNYYKMAYQIVTEIGDDFQTTMTLNNIATVYMQIEDWERANTYIHQAMTLYHENQYSNSLFEAILYGNASAIHFANNQYEAADSYMQRAINEAEQTGSIIIKVITLADMAERNAKVGNSNKALTVAQRCVNLAKEQSDSNTTLAICYDALASAYLSQHNYPLVIDYASRVLDTITQSNVDEIVWESSVLKKLIEAYENQGNYQQALNLMKREALVRKKYYDQTYNEEILSEKNSLERKLSRREIELLEAKNELQETRLQEQRWREILISTLFLILGYLVLRVLMRLKHTNRELRSQNTTDTLTGLHNRRYLKHWLTQRSTTKQPGDLLVCVVDIDHFKRFNDQHGHDIGDEVLKQTAKNLQNSIRKQDTLVRWGGEEFIVIVSLHSSQQANETLERLRSNVETAIIDCGRNTFQVTISIGACVCPSQHLHAQWERTFSSADNALYRAKRAGRNQYQVHREPD